MPEQDAEIQSDPSVISRDESSAPARLVGTPGGYGLMVPNDRAVPFHEMV
jgi:hypothetical protein